MKNAKDTFANIVAVIYFFGIMLGTIFLLIYAPTRFFSDILKIRESGFSTIDAGLAVIAFLGLAIGISLLVPAFRRMYYKLPWLFPLVKILYVNVVILAIATSIMNYGYGVQDAHRHTIFFILTISAIVIGRLLMCLWFHKKKVEYIGGKTNA
jgi:predicted membrane protein